MSVELVQSLLRPSDNLRCLLTVEIADQRPLVPSADAPLHLAIVTHRNDLTEVGGILVLSASTTVSVIDVLPITQHLALAVAQTGPPNSQTAESVPTASPSTWLLSIKRDAHDTRPLAFAVHTRNSTRVLQTFTAECRRLKEIATATLPVDTDFAWAEAYVSDPSSHRLDLRLRKQPLHARLSLGVAGLSEDDVSDISLVRHDWIEHAAAKQTTSGNVQHLKIRLGTFNVNGKAPSQDLYPWLRDVGPKNQVETGWISPLELSPFEVPHEGNSLAGTTDLQAFGDPDMLVLGFQELDLSTEALLYTTSTLKEDEWLTAIFAGLGEKRVLYEKLTSRQLVGMLLIVIVKKALVPCFTDIRSCDAGSGIMGFMGNKGATAIRLEFTPKISSDSQTTTYRSTIFTFVNAHLAASDEFVERRNYDFQELSGRLAFPPDEWSESYPPTSLARDTYNIYQSDVLFWMGGETFHDRPRMEPHTFGLDLNYRLDLPEGDVRRLLFSHASGIDGLRTLLSYDQLGAVIRSNKAFAGFTEHPITHIPTYRLALGVSKDRLGYDMKRKPAWTDRILYMTPPDVRVAQLAYKSHPEITMSDHQPVSADFDISLPFVDQPQYESVASALHRELAGFEDSGLQPKVKVQPISIEFGTVIFKQAINREVVIQNEGDIPCVFRFLGAGAGSEPISPSWLRIEPTVGLLRPHETMTIRLSVYVGNESAAKLNVGSRTVECTLILHTALGKDHFLAVSGCYQYTCFANTLERLTRLNGPIRTLESPEATALGQVLSAPREIMRLINWMMAHASATDTLPFEYLAQESLCHVIRECLDTGDEFPSEGSDGDQHGLVAAVANTLVLFLDSLIEPVVPPRLHAQCLQARDKDEAFEVLNAFPHESINVWISLTAFLHYIAQQDVANPTGPTRAHRLASIFAPILLRDDPTDVCLRTSPVGKRDFLLHFIG